MNDSVDIGKYDIIIKSPGIKPNTKLVIEAIERQIPVISDLELFYKLFKHNKMILVTGTNGKTTTANYIYQLLRNAGFPKIQGLKYIGDSEVCFNSGDYGCDGKYFQYQLFIRDYASNKVSRIYFNKEDYHESTMQPIEESTLIALIKKWDYLKKR